MHRDKRFTGDDTLLDPDVTREIGRLRKERREAAQTQSAERKHQNTHTSRTAMKAGSVKG